MTSKMVMLMMTMVAVLMTITVVTMMIIMMASDNFSNSFYLPPVKTFSFRIWYNQVS